MIWFFSKIRFSFGMLKLNLTAMLFLELLILDQIWYGLIPECSIFFFINPGLKFSSYFLGKYVFSFQFLLFNIFVMHMKLVNDSKVSL